MQNTVTTWGSWGNCPHKHHVTLLEVISCIENGATPLGECLFWRGQDLYNGSEISKLTYQNKMTLDEAKELEARGWPVPEKPKPVSYTHLTLPTNREV